MDNRTEKPLVIFGEKHGCHRTIALRDNPEAMRAGAIRGEQPSSVLEGLIVGLHILPGRDPPNRHWHVASEPSALLRW